MKLIKNLTLALLLIPSLALANPGMLMIAGDGVATTPEGEVVIAANDVTVDSDPNLSETGAKGQSFIPTATKNLTKINIYIASWTSGTITCRVGDNDNLTTYLEEASGTPPGVGYFDVEFSGTTELTGSATYYFGCIVSNAPAEVGSDTTMSYTSGVFVYSLGGTWDMSSSSSSSDMVFIVYGE